MKTGGDDDEINRGQQFYIANKTVIKKENRKNKSLIGFFLACLIHTNFEVRYTNKTLCACGKANITFVHCQTKLPLNFTVYISAKKIPVQNPKPSVKCHFLFVYEDKLWPQKEKFTLDLGNTSEPSCNKSSSSAGVPVLSTAFLMEVSGITKTNFTNFTTSVIGQSRGTSSMTNSQYLRLNYTVNSSKTRWVNLFSEKIGCNFVKYLTIIAIWFYLLCSIRLLLKGICYWTSIFREHFRTDKSKHTTDIACEASHIIIYHKALLLLDIMESVLNLYSVS